MKIVKYKSLTIEGKTAINKVIAETKMQMEKDKNKKIMGFSIMPMVEKIYGFADGEITLTFDDDASNTRYDNKIKNSMNYLIREAEIQLLKEKLIRDVDYSMIVENK